MNRTLAFIVIIILLAEHLLLFSLRKCLDKSTSIIFVGIIFFEFIFSSKYLIIEMPFIGIGWPNLTILILGFAFLCSLLNLIGNIALAKAYQSAESSWLAPLDYSYLIFATLWSKIIFGYWPSYSILIGLCLIGFSGLLIAYREKIKLKF